MLMSSVVMMALLTAAPAPKASPLTWKVTGTDVTFEMSSKDLRALRDGKEVFGFQSRKKGFLANLVTDDPQDIPEGAPDTSDWEAAQSYTVLSVVGPWVSYEDNSGGFTGGALYANRIYVTEDVTKDKDRSAFNLLDVFPEKEVLEALKADEFVKQHVDDEEAFKNSRTVEAMLGSLVPGHDCVGFQIDNVKRSVAFHHVEGNKVAVRISFGYERPVCRGKMFEVGVLLPIPESLRPALERARTRQEGFLMKDARTVKAPAVHFEWEGSKQKKP